jgi:hypothetical protein
MQAVITLAVSAPPGPPSSAAGFLDRLAPGWLEQAYAGDRATYSKDTHQVTITDTTPDTLARIIAQAQPGARQFGSATFPYRGNDLNC